MNKDYIDWERQTYERRKTRNERKRFNRYRLCLILAIMIWVLVLLFVLELPVRSDEPEPAKVNLPTHEELVRRSMLAMADLDKPAQEPFVVTYPYYDVPLSHELQGDLRCACDEFGVDMPLMLALIRRETEFRNVMGDGGESYGYCQIQTRWWSGLMKEIGAEDLMIPLDNFRTGCAIMANLLEEYSLEEALTCYNSGSPGKSRYANTVMRYMEEINVER